MFRACCWLKRRRSEEHPLRQPSLASTPSKAGGGGGDQPGAAAPHLERGRRRRCDLEKCNLDLQLARGVCVCVEGGEGEASPARRPHLERAVAVDVGRHGRVRDGAAHVPLPLLLAARREGGQAAAHVGCGGGAGFTGVYGVYGFFSVVQGLGLHDTGSGRPGCRARRN